MSSLTVDELVAYVLFDADPRIAKAQRPLHSFLVSLALYGTADGLTDDEVYDGVVRLLPVDPSAVSQADVLAAISAHVELELVVRDGEGLLHLSEGRRTQLEDAGGRLTMKRRVFHEHLVKAVEGRGVVLTPADEQLLRELVETHLVELLQAQSSKIAAAWSTKGAGFDAGLPKLNSREHAREIASALSPGGARLNKLRRAAITLGLEAGIGAVPPEGEAYLAALDQRTVAMALLEQDPSLRRVRTQLAKDRIAYLDANVVLSAMFAADNSHEVALEALDLTHALGVSVRVTTATVEEVSNRISEAGRWLRQYKGDSRFLEVLDDFVVRSYHRATRDLPELDQGGFIAAFEPPAAWLREHKIAVDKLSVETRVDGRVAEIRAALARARPKASMHVLETDAINVVHVARVRETHPADEMGNRVWLVTLDHALAEPSRPRLDLVVPPEQVSRLAENWIDLLSPCLPPEEERLSGYVTHLVQSQFSLVAEDPTLVNKQFLLTLQKSRFQISGVLDSNVERARQVLVELQMDRDLGRLVEHAEPDDDAWNEKLEEIVKRALHKMEESPERVALIEAERRARLEAETHAAEEHKARLRVRRELARRTSESPLRISRSTTSRTGASEMSFRSNFEGGKLFPGGAAHFGVPELVAEG